MTPAPPSDIRPFAELARGPVASVFKAVDRATGEVVLLKALRPAAAADPERRARFAEEARLASGVDHPNVVRVRHVDADGGSLVADWVEGRDLQAVLDDCGALPAALAVYVAREAALGLEAVHAAGILHRDVKPANVLLGLDGSVRLTDFGLASLAPEPGGESASGAEVRGTLATLAPEIVRGESAGPASDLFSLGAVLAHGLTGRAPFGGATASETLDAVLHADPAAALAADPRVPPPLAALAAALLAKDPSARPDAASLAERLDDLQDAIGRADAAGLAAFLDDPAGYVPPTPPEPTPYETAPSRLDVIPDVRVDAGPVPTLRRRWPVAGAIAAVAVLIGAALLVRAPRAPQPGRPFFAEEPPAQTPLVISPVDSAGSAAVPTPEVAVGTAVPEVSAPAGPSPAPTETLRPPTSSPAPPLAQTPAPADPAPAPEPAPPVGTGTLAVVADPWAAVRVDGRAVGTTPVAAFALAAGAHEVTFENPAFPAHTLSVRVGAGEAARASVSLWALVGRVTLDVAPWARVVVDGRLWDTVPPQTRPLVLAPGEHTLRFEHPTLGTREQRLRVAAGEQRTVRIRMTDPAD